MTLILRTNLGPSPNNNAALPMSQKIADKAIMDLTQIGLVAWWRPDNSLVVENSGNGTQGSGPNFKWHGLVSGQTLVPMSDTGPQLIASAFNSQPCIRFNTSAAGRPGRLWLPGVTDFWRPAADMTIAVVAKFDAGTNEAVIGNDAATSDSAIRHNTGGSMSVIHSGSQLFTSTAPGDTNPFMGLWSYDAATHTGVWQQNGVTTNTVTVATEVSSGHIFTVGQEGNNADIDRGDIYEIFVFYAALAKASMADYLAVLNAYRTARYGF